MYVFRGLKVKKPLMNQQKYLKEGFVFAFWLILTFYSNMTWINSIFRCNLSFINPLDAQIGLKSFLKKFGVFSVLVCCAAKLMREK